MGGRGVEVRTGDLVGFAREVRGGVDERWVSVEARASAGLNAGATIGVAFDSGHLYEAKLAYEQAMATTVANLRAYVESARRYADIATKVAELFERADRGAQLGVSEILELMDSQPGQVVSGVGMAVGAR